MTKEDNTFITSEKTTEVQRVRTKGKFVFELQLFSEGITKTKATMLYSDICSLLTKHRFGTTVKLSCDISPGVLSVGSMRK